jgi:hypothetical protein
MLSDAKAVRIRCRQIAEADIGAVIDLLTRGFPERGRDYWVRGFERLERRPLPPDYPPYGYLLENDGAPVGVVLLLFASFAIGGKVTTRCNLSSWYVEPAFRSHASLLTSFALRHKEITYVNISPARHTWSIVEAQGFKHYSGGQFLALAALGAAGPGVKLHLVEGGASDRPQLAIPEASLLSTHAGYGCLSVICETPDGSFPFVFLPLRARKGPLRLPSALLVYCRDMMDFTRFAGPLGRFLLKRGILFVTLDANGPIEGLIGVYRESRGRKYYRGPEAPRLGDLAFTELVLFGP